MADEELESLPVERLVEMLRAKRKDEAAVRARLKDAETRAEAAQGAVLAFQRASFEQAAADAGVAQTAIGDLGSLVDISTLVSADGLLDGAKTTAALQALKGDRPHLFQQSGAAKGTGDMQFSGAAGDLGGTTATWADVLAPQ